LRTEGKGQQRFNMQGVGCPQVHASRHEQVDGRANALGVAMRQSKDDLISIITLGRSALEPPEGLMRRARVLPSNLAE
jgi:hypothetical protein